MKQTRTIMGMHITIEVVDDRVMQKDIEDVFNYFKYIDDKFSTYKSTSEISHINNGRLKKNKYSQDMQIILALSDETKRESNGYFDINHDGKIDPSGIVKGWAIGKVAEILHKKGFQNFYIDAGGDIQVSGKNHNGQPWRVGIRNPFNTREIVKVLVPIYKGVATSGTYIRGQHIYNPTDMGKKITEIVSLTIIGPTIYDADRMATATFAMGRSGIFYLRTKPEYEGYMIDRSGNALYTLGFEKFVLQV